MPRIIVKFFGPARQLTGETDATMEIGERETLGILSGRLAERYAKLGVAAGLRLAVNREYVALDHVLNDGDEVAVIPPVSGGSAGLRVILTREPIDVAAICRELKRDDAGAMTTFVGTVRQESVEGRALTGLFYAAYEEMAMEQMQIIHRKAGEKFEIFDAAVVHRLGQLKIGETSIVVAVVSAHRAAAFQACQWIVDTVKANVPIWKKDLGADGTESWVDPKC